MFKSFCLFMVALFSLATFSQNGNTQLSAELKRVNKKITSENLPLMKIDQESLLKWLPETFLFLGKHERKSIGITDLHSSKYFINTLSLALTKTTPKNAFIYLNDQTFSFPWSQNFMTIMDENGYLFNYTEKFARNFCFNPSESRNLCKENYRGANPDLKSFTQFPKDVKVNITEITVEGICLLGHHCEHDSLKVEVLATHKNIESIISYFAAGISPESIRRVLNTKLKNKASSWVDIRLFFSKWARERINTFPADTDNEVCHGPARQFFNDTLYNGAYDRSTETTAILLKDHYCHVPNQKVPYFGDYMYIPSMHSGRFIMIDPKSKRWINFSVQSGGASPYRIWWSDEDFSGQPFSKNPDPDFLERVDIWRRCRD